MGTFAQKQNQSQEQVSSDFARSNKAIPGLNHHATPPLHLQRAIDNQAIQRLPQTHAEELEESSTSTAPSCYAHDFSRIPVHAQRQTEAEKLIQRRTTGDTHVDAAPPNAHEVLRSSGQPLDAATRAFMEPRFGHDFSRVRVHLDFQAAASARNVGALAYTVGRDIVFARGQFAPHNAVGQRLLAHELAHTVQQTAGADQVTTGDLRVGPKNDPLEHEAERVSTSALSARDRVPSERRATTALRSDGRPTLRRQPSPGPHIPEVPPIETMPKKEEGGEKTPTPTKASTATEAPCKSSAKAPLPCSPQGVSNDDFLKHGGPQEALGVTIYKLPIPAPPEVVTKPIGKSKKVGLQPTTATQVPCESFFVQADEKQFFRITPLNTNDPKQKANADKCPGGRYLKGYRVVADGAKKIQEAEMDHCKDLQYAFDISVGCYAAVVNDFAKRKTFTSDEEAVDAVTKRVGGRTPDTWAKRYADLLEKTKVRDTRHWHTPPHPKGPMEGVELRGGYCQSAQATLIDGTLYPEVGKGLHPSSEIIK